MASFIKVTLDTKSPEIEIIAPNYITPQTSVEITIQGNEELGSYQEFYFIDSLGGRTDYIFDHFGDQFVGRMVFNETSFGIGKFYARVKDLVDNESSLMSTSINVIESEILTIEMSYQITTPESESTEYELLSEYETFENDSEFYERDMETEYQENEITIEWSEL